MLNFDSNIYFASAGFRKDGFVDLSYSPENSASGALTSKTVDFKSYITHLSSNVSDSDVELPHRCFRKKVVGSNVFYFMFLEQSVKSIEWKSGSHTRSYSKVPIPKTLMVSRFTEKDGELKLGKTYLFALSCLTGSVSPKTVLYSWPFFNYSPQYSSGVCWGNDNVSIDLIHSTINSNINRMSFMYDLYFSSVFNSDLSGRYINDDVVTMSDENMLLRLNELSVFPENGLVQMRDVRTFSDFLTKIEQGRTISE